MVRSGPSMWRSSAGIALRSRLPGLSTRQQAMSPNLRRILHVWVAEVLYYSAALTIWRWFRRRMLHKDVVCVLGLHRVLTRDEQERSNSLDGMVIREDTYLKLLAHVQKRFQVLSLDSFLNI